MVSSKELQSHPPTCSSTAWSWQYWASWSVDLPISFRVPSARTWVVTSKWQAMPRPLPRLLVFLMALVAWVLLLDRCLSFFFFYFFFRCFLSGGLSFAFRAFAAAPIFALYFALRCCYWTGGSFLWVPLFAPLLLRRFSRCIWRVGSFPGSPKKLVLRFCHRVSRVRMQLVFCFLLNGAFWPILLLMMTLTCFRWYCCVADHRSSHGHCLRMALSLLCFHDYGPLIFKIICVC